MRKALTIRKITDNSKEYKATIQEDLKCHRCSPNKGENTNYHRSKTDKYKDKRKGKI